MVPWLRCFTSNTVLGVLYSATFAIVVAYIIWNLGIQRIGGARTAFYSNLTPVIATLLATIFLGETLTVLKVVGADNLFVADASVMPEVSRTNTNIPTIMIAERIAEAVRQR